MDRSRLLKSAAVLYRYGSHASPQCRACVHGGWRYAETQAAARLSIWMHRCDHVPPGHAAESSTLTATTSRRYQPHTKTGVAGFASAAVPQERQAKSCWFCGDCTKTEQQFSCNNCGYLQPPDSKTDFFTLFGLSRVFDIDQKTLERQFRDMQTTVHPDKHARKGDDIKDIAQQQSAHLNMGFSILRCPLARAKYLLELEGKPIDEQARMDDPEFLMEVMELREEVASAHDSEDIKQLMEANLQRRTDYAERIRQAYAAGDLDAMVEFVQELTYFHRIEQSLRDKL